MFLKILAHPVFANLNFHMPMIVDLSHPLVMLTGENGSGKSTLLHSIHYALRGEQTDGYVYKLDRGGVKKGKVFLFDAEQHNPRMQLEFFKDQPEMMEFLQLASHGQVMLAMFQENFPALERGTTLLARRTGDGALGIQPAAHSEDADGTCGSARIPDRLRDAFAGADRRARNLCHQPRQSREPQCSAGIVRS